MSLFPRTVVGGVSVSRMIIGTNWFLGWSHCTNAKDQLIHTYARNPKHIADILEVFFNAGVDTILGDIVHDDLYYGIQEAQQRTGVRAIMISTPGLPFDASTPAQGFDSALVGKTLDFAASRDVTFLLPHQATTDAMLDLASRKIRQMDGVCRMIREHGMIPGLSTHAPEAIIYADESGLDVETYLCIYNAMAFLMHVEVDWTAKLINEAKKPVIAFKTMAAGQIRPFQAMHFVWNTIRPRDMVAVGVMTPMEAQELIDMSLQILDGQERQIELQTTRSKQSVIPR